MKPRSNADTEHAWIDAWNELASLTAGLERFEIVLPDERRADPETCRAWLQSSAYEGFCVALRRYRRKDARYEIHARRWPWGEPSPAWEPKTATGFVLDP